MTSTLPSGAQAAVGSLNAALIICSGAWGERARTGGAPSCAAVDLASTGRASSTIEAAVQACLCGCVAPRLTVRAVPLCSTVLRKPEATRGGGHAKSRSCVVSERVQLRRAELRVGSLASTVARMGVLYLLFIHPATRARHVRVVAPTLLHAGP